MHQVFYTTNPGNILPSSPLCYIHFKGNHWPIQKSVPWRCNHSSPPPSYLNPPLPPLLPSFFFLFPLLLFSLRRQLHWVRAPSSFQTPSHIPKPFQPFQLSRITHRLPHSIVSSASHSDFGPCTVCIFKVCGLVDGPLQP